MIKTATAVLVALVATLALSTSAGGSGSVVRPFRIIAMSHTHPAGKSYSWVCAKIDKNTSMKAKVIAMGDWGELPRGRKTIRGKGTRIVRFKITSPGRYTFKVQQGRQFQYKSYVVPEPPSPANGPFSCV